MIYWPLFFLSLAIEMASLKFHGIASVFPMWKSSSDLFIKKHFISYLTGFCSIGSPDNPMLKLQDHCSYFDSRTINASAAMWK